MLAGMMKKKRNVITNRTDEDFDDFEKVAPPSPWAAPHCSLRIPMYTQRLSCRGAGTLAFSLRVSGVWLVLVGRGRALTFS